MEEQTLARMKELSAELIRRSPADLTLLCWVEGAVGEFVESSRTRKSSLEPRRDVELAVRWGQRTGRAHLGSAEAADLERALRHALASARIQPDSPDWRIADAAEPVEETPAIPPDPTLLDWNPQRVRRLLLPWLQDRTSLRLRWAVLRIVVASSFGPLRSAELTGVTVEARVGPRPGSGFASRSARTLDALDLDSLVELASERRAPRTERFEAEGARPLVIAAEAAVVLLEALGRLALGSSSPPLAEGEDLRWSPRFEVRDDPHSLPGLPLAFDHCGLARTRRPAIERGRRVLRALDPDAAAREELQPTAHSLGGGLAWPIHLEMPADGGVAEEELLGRSAGGLRVGSIDGLSIEPWPPYRFQARARSVRRILDDGRLGDGVPPLLWESSLSEVFGSLDAWGQNLAVWSPPGAEALGATRCPSLVLAPLAALRTDPQP